MSKQFQYLLDTAAKKGLQLNSKLARKCVDGVFGMYATSTICSGEQLAGFPVGQLIKAEEGHYPAGTSNTARLIHSAAKAYAQGDASEYHYIFSLFDTVEELKSYSSYFAGKDDLTAFRKLGLGLYKEILSQNEKNSALIEALYAFDPSIDRDIYTMLCLNFNSRAVGSHGFVPIIDCFNHSDEKGANIDSRGESVSLSAKVDYQPGEQVFTTYGTLDLLTHAINYNYFDRLNPHFIQLHKRLRFIAKTANDQALLKQLAGRFKLAIQKVAQGYVYTFQGNEAYFSETQPSRQLIDIAIVLAEHAGHRSSPKEILSGFLQQIEAENTVETCSKKTLPKRFSRFYKVLHKEKQMLQANKSWVMQNL